MTAATGTSETLTLTEAVKRYNGLSRTTLRNLIEAGCLSKCRNNPLAKRSRIHLFADEIEEYRRLSAMGLEEPRFKAAMRQYRINAGRLKAK